MIEAGLKRPSVLGKSRVLNTNCMPNFVHQIMRLATPRRKMINDAAAVNRPRVVKAEIHIDVATKTVSIADTWNVRGSAIELGRPHSNVSLGHVGDFYETNPRVTLPSAKHVGHQTRSIFCPNTLEVGVDLRNVYSDCGIA